MLIRNLWPAFVWTLFIQVLTLIPGSALPKVSFFQIDKIVHVFFFSVLMALSSYGLRKISHHRSFSINPSSIACAYCIGLGILIEILQLGIPGRDFSFVDILADSVGVGLGYLAFIFLPKGK